jgi:hypothetical protein
MLDDGPEWRFRARVVLDSFEATRLPSWLGGGVVSRGRARGRARRAVAYSYPAIEGDEETGRRGLVGVFETDPRRRAEAEPFTEETTTGVRCGYEFRFAVAVDPEANRATWPDPGSDRAAVREALAGAIREALGDAGGGPSSVTVERLGPNEGP